MRMMMICASQNDHGRAGFQRGLAWRRVLACACLILSSDIGHVLASDIVWYLPPEPRGSQTNWLPQPLRKLTGTVVTIDDQSVEVVVDAGGLQAKASGKYDQERIVWISPDWSAETPTIQQAFASYNSGDFTGCIPALRQYVTTSKNRWKQQLAYGYLLQAAGQTNNLSAALQILASFHN